MGQPITFDSNIINNMRPTYYISLHEAQKTVFELKLLWKILVHARINY